VRSTQLSDHDQRADADVHAVLPADDGDDGVLPEDDEEDDGHVHRVAVQVLEEEELVSPL
jgi:hypothetical protein